jgi:hypothetical protein
MVSPALEKSVEEVSSRAIRNPSHGLARGDCRRCADDRRRAYVTDNHGGLTPPAFVLHESASAGDLRFPLHARYLTTGDSRPPLLVVHAFVHRESRHFAGTRSRLQTGAAGVSPPWVAETHLQGRYRKRAGDCRRWAGERRRNHGRPTTGAYAPRSWLYMRLCIAKVVISPAHVRACKQERRASARRGVRKRVCKGDTASMQETAAARLGLADVIAIAFAGRASLLFRVIARWHCECVSANHGGMTPPLLCCTNAFLLGICGFRCTRVTQPRGADSPALGCACVCASQKSPFRLHTFAHSNRSGGRACSRCCRVNRPSDVIVIVPMPYVWRSVVV